MVGCPPCLCTPLYVHTPPYICTPPVYLYAPRGVHTPPWAPHALSVPAWFWSIVCCGGLFFYLMCIGAHHPYLGVPPPYYTPTLLVSYLCIVILRDVSSYVGAFPLLLKGLGVFPPSLGEVWGTSALCCSHVHSYTFFVVHYVSCLDHGSDYYSSRYCGIFWPVISVSGSFPNRVSWKPWCGSTTTLDAEELWKCSWLRFCAAAAYSIFNASSGLCQLCYGFSTGRFLFQS